MLHGLLVNYQKTPGQCESELVAVLECQYQAPEEVLCAHEADQKCLRANRELKSCQHGTTHVGQTTVEGTSRVRPLSVRLAQESPNSIEKRGASKNWRACGARGRPR